MRKRVERERGEKKGRTPSVGADKNSA